MARTAEPWEAQSVINYLPPVALAAGLPDTLASKVGAWIVAVRSAGYRSAPVISDDCHSVYRRYDDMPVYGQTRDGSNVLATVAAEPLHLLAGRARAGCRRRSVCAPEVDGEDTRHACPASSEGGIHHA